MEDPNNLRLKLSDASKWQFHGQGSMHFVFRGTDEYYDKVLKVCKLHKNKEAKQEVGSLDFMGFVKPQPFDKLISGRKSIKPFVPLYVTFL